MQLSDDALRCSFYAHPGKAALLIVCNFGKSAALAAGFDRARGQIVFTLDADLQDDPACNYIQDARAR